jgi:hypothetical protein
LRSTPGRALLPRARPVASRSVRANCLSRSSLIPQSGVPLASTPGVAWRRGGHLHVRFEVSICIQSVGGFVACNQRFIGLKWRRQDNKNCDTGHRRSDVDDLT